MKEAYVQYLVCPECKSQLDLSIIEQENGRVKTGYLICPSCSTHFPIRNFIPRFVSSENYASSFGFQWKRLGHLQYDSISKRPITEERFFATTGWEKDLTGQIILEAGSGGGRFTEIVTKTNAFVISFDYSEAVEINYEYNGHHENLFILQADIYHMPFPDAYFDKVFCFGVLQHLPDVEKGFFSLVPKVKMNGQLAIDVYNKTIWRMLFYTKYWLRPFTRQMNKEKLFHLIEKWVSFWWNKVGWISKKLPYGRLIVKNLFFIADYRGLYDLPDETLKQWAILDTFDMFSPAYDQPQTMKTVRRWFQQGGFCDVLINYGYNGIYGRGTRCKEMEKKS
jgi:uncharacterized protein YbaR (Trm112 family)/ubiquinone/menaquinone biosynthesis C-methylase UbiE